MNASAKSDPDSANESKRRQIADLVVGILLQQEREAGRELDLPRRAKIIATLLGEMRRERIERAKSERDVRATAGWN